MNSHEVAEEEEKTDIYFCDQQLYEGLKKVFVERREELVKTQAFTAEFISFILASGKDDADPAVTLFVLNCN